jgi:hypothetical protein
MNAVTRLRRTRCEPDEILVLLPSCLQCSECREKVSVDVDNCLRCGRCKIKDVLELCERLGVRCAVATGGRLAMKLAGDREIKAVVAVACEQELHEGMFGVFPKPSLGVINLRPNGPCTDTDVDMEELEEALNWLLRD